MSPLGALKAGGAAVGGFFSAVGRRAATQLTFVPIYLQNILWLLSQKFLDLARGGYGGNSAVYAVLHVLSQAVSEPPMIAYTKAVGKGQPTPLPDTHPLVKLLIYPNELMTQYEMWELVTLQLGITGRSTWWKERNNAGEIIALWPLRPDRVGPVYSDSSGADTVISGWSYLVPGTSNYQWIPRADVWMVNFPDPAGDSGGMVEGLGPLQVLASEVGADNEATKFVGSMLANYGSPGMMIHTKASLNTQADVDVIKAAARQEFGGIKRGSPGVLDADTTITQVGFNLQQLEFPALRKVAESRIAAAYGVPAILAGLQVGLESGIRATIAEQREYFAETTCVSYWRRYEGAWNRDIAAEMDATAVCTFDMSHVTALQTQDVKAKEKMLELFTAGAASYNDLRAAHGLPPLAAGGDRRVLPRGSVEIDENGSVVEVGGVPLQEAVSNALHGLLPGAQPSAPVPMEKKPGKEAVAA